ncbi:hypothetical protein TNCV_3521241 [Trichonephila clavipes]|nr:hypothetical protein TNCV_3521241 [Trichonephila clavipes]
MYLTSTRLWAPGVLSLPAIWGCEGEARCGYVVLLMACYWVVEPIPVAATSLLPVVLFPLLGVITTSEASSEYMNGTNMMFVGGLFMAVAIEECNLHKRIALNVLCWVGATPSWMMFGFMGTSMFLSMWISNTATAALMVPIIEAVMEEMGDKASNDEEGHELKKISVISIDVKPVTENGISSDSHTKDADTSISLSSHDSTNRQHKIGILRRALFLSVAYSSNIGGTGTLTGTGPNLVVKSVAEKLFPESNELTFDKWMMFNVPVMLLCVFVAWGYLFLVHVRKASTIYTSSIKKSLDEIIKKRHEELGPMTNVIRLRTACVIHVAPARHCCNRSRVGCGAFYSLVVCFECRPEATKRRVMVLVSNETSNICPAPAVKGKQTRHLVSVYVLVDSRWLIAFWPRRWGCRSPVVKVSDHGRSAMSSSPVLLKSPV